MQLEKFNKDKLGSEFKFLIKTEKDKKLQKIKELIGHRLRDYISYPV